MDDPTIDLDDSRERLPFPVEVKIISGPHSGMCYTFDREAEIVFGRAAAAHVKLPDEGACSQVHFKLLLCKDRLSCIDLNSRNGLQLNGMTVSAGTVVAGDRLCIGGTTILVDQLVEVLAQPPSIAGRGDKESADLRQASSFTSELAKPEMRFEVAGTPRATDSPSCPTPAESTATIEFFPEIGDALNSSTDTLPRIGAYDLLGQVGRGGMGIVYRARHRKSGAKRAVKLVLFESQLTDKLRNLFFREAGVMLRLRHPRIVRAYEFGIYNETPFLVMELLQPLCIENLVEQMPYGRRTKVSCWIASRVLDALSYAHSRGVVHRDVKPRNIIGYRAGRHLKVKLGDFGLAKYFDDAGMSSLTDERSLRGTLAYMAPEQLLNAKNAGPSVDIYATGACLFRLLTGHSPPVGIQDNQEIVGLLDNPNIPKALQQAVTRSLQAKPGRRFASAAAFAAAIRSFA